MILNGKGNIRFYVHAAAVLSMLFWGLSFVWSTQVFQYYTPLTTIFFRLALSSLILYLTLHLSGILEKLQKKHIGLFLASALFNPFFYFIGENYGLKLTTPTVSAVIIATIPVFTPVFTFYFLKERLTIYNYTGIIISFCGIIVMLFNRSLQLNIPLAGLGLLTLAVLSAIAYSIYLKKLTRFYTPLTIITYQNIIGVFYFLPFFLYFDLTDAIQVQVTGELITSLLLLAIFASSMAFICFTFVIKHIGVNKANVYTNLIPVITAIFSFIVLSEQFTQNKTIGMGIVILGVYLAQKKVRNKKLIK